LARIVKTTSGVRDFIRDAGVKQICEELNTLSAFHNAIARFIDGWDELLSRDRCDSTIVILISEVLRDWAIIEDALRARMELPAEWRQNEDNWDLYRTAIAVATLQAYYESL
jgi:hypothetical protein